MDRKRVRENEEDGERGHSKHGGTYHVAQDTAAASGSSTDTNTDALNASLVVMICHRLWHDPLLYSVIPASVLELLTCY